ncbi:MAG TPA: hypothetical protein VIF02_01800 [Methylocella sp.]|jgi:hypothetical protein
MTPGTRSNHAANLSSLSRRSLRPAITQVFISDLFVEYNQQYEETNTYYAYCAATKRWHVARDTYCTEWEHAEWSDTDDPDITPLIFRDIIDIIRPLAETSSHAEQRRVMSHGFIAGVVRLLQNDSRMRITPWDLEKTIPPVAEELEKERVEKLYGRNT